MSRYASTRLVPPSLFDEPMLLQHTIDQLRFDCELQAVAAGEHVTGFEQRFALSLQHDREPLPRTLLDRLLRRPQRYAPAPVLIAVEARAVKGAAPC